MNSGTCGAQRIAILGLGNMGSGMAHRMLEAGHEVVAYNRTRSHGEVVERYGGRMVATAREAAEAADVVISMVADDEASRAVWLGEAGALAGARQGAVLIESSTLSVPWVLELAGSAAKCGFGFLDAPVTGSKPQAETGELLFLVGGESQLVEQARKILASMGRGLVHLGPVGCGALMKLINNFLGAVHAAGLAEALALIEDSELDRAAALQILSNGAPGSPILKTIAPRMVARDYAPRFALRWIAKDLKYLLEEANRKGISLKVAQVSLSRFQDAIQAGWAEYDFSAVIEPLRRTMKS